jgi:hypothetical protein
LNDEGVLPELPDNESLNCNVRLVLALPDDEGDGAVAIVVGTGNDEVDEVKEEELEGFVVVGIKISTFKGTWRKKGDLERRWWW